MNPYKYQTPNRSTLSEFSLRSHPTKVKRYQAGLSKDLPVVVEREAIVNKAPNFKPSAISEFFLRSHPRKVKRYQAGLSKDLVTESETTCKKSKRETQRRGSFMREETQRIGSFMRDSETFEDSIELDVLTIAMSYPEGRQKVFERYHEVNYNKSSRDLVKGPCVRKVASQSTGNSSLVDGNNFFMGDVNDSSMVKENNNTMQVEGNNITVQVEENNNTMQNEVNNNLTQDEGNNNTMQVEVNNNLTQDEGNNITVQVEENNNSMQNEVNNNLTQDEGNNNTMQVEVNNNSMQDEGNNNTMQFEGNNNTMMVEGNNNTMMVEGNNNMIEDGKTKSFKKSGINEKIWYNGTIVWGKFTKNRWWPGLVITGPMAGQKEAKPGWIWLMWFQDHKISQVRLHHVVEFYKEFRQYSRGKLSILLEGAIIEALQECADRANISVQGYEDVKLWGLKGTGFQNLVESDGNDTDLFAPKTGSEIPSIFLRELEQLRRKANKLNIAKESSMSYNSDTVHAGSCETPESVDCCLSCTKHGNNLVCHHPIFEGEICGNCKNLLFESLLAIDKDGFYLFCCVCGNGGDLFVCEEMTCGRTFCVTCLKRYLSTDAFLLVKYRSHWSCCLCEKYHEKLHGQLVPREGWEDELIKFYNPVFDQVTLSNVTPNSTNRKIRVLSLFDGIGIVKLALDQLHLDIDVYYSSETDVMAQQVSKFNHGYTIVQIGDIDKITTQKLEELCPIDLVVARPPMEDLDVTYRGSRGFNGTGIKILKVIDILKKIEFICKGNNSVYFLVESSSTIKSEYREVLSNFFEKEPCMWDAQFFSPYIYPKFYWGNIPGLYSSRQFYKEIGQIPTLDTYLAQDVGRSAQVDKLRGCAIAMRREKNMQDITEDVFDDPESDMTMMMFDDKEGDVNNNEREVLGIELTDNVNSCQEYLYSESTDDEIVDSSRKRKSKIDDNTIFSFPVKMDGKDTNIWPTEVEKILGLPIHYTDAAISTRQRQNYLINASSVFVLKHLLTPLTGIFSTHSL